MAYPSEKPDKLLDIRSLNALTRLAKCGSFHEAARQLGVTTSALSQTIRNLEQDIGQPLIDRTTRPVCLTRFAQDALPAIERLVDDATALRRRLGEFAHHAPRHLRLGCIDSFAATVGPALIRSLDTHKNSSQLYAGLAPDIARQLVERHIDFAVTTDPMTEHESIRCLPLFKERWIGLYPESQGPKVIKTSAELRKAAHSRDFVRYSLRSRIGAQIERYVVHHGIRADRRFEFDQTDTLLSMVAANMGWAVSTPLCLLQSRHILPRVDTAELADGVRGSREFFLLWREDVDQHQATQLATVILQIMRGPIAKEIRQTLQGLPDDLIEFTT